MARLTTEMYLSDMVPALNRPTPSPAWRTARVERVDIDKLEGRVTGVLLTPYPPGIPLLIPGERFRHTIVQYLQFAREFNERFPLRNLHPRPGRRSEDGGESATTSTA